MVKKLKSKKHVNVVVNTPESRRSKRKQNHKKSTWKAGANDAVRQSVEADGLKTIVDMAADGNCLFRALSDQLYSDYGNRHEQVRCEICDLLEKHKEDFSMFLVLDEEESDEDASDFETYVQNMREDGEWGGNLELVAASRLYRRDIVVFSANFAAFTIPHGDDKPSGPALLLSYHDNDHYNSVRTCGDSRESLTATVSEPPRLRSDPTTNLSNGVVRKSGLCPCGSKMKYRKCCMTAGKQKSKKVKGKETTIVEEQGDLNGGFRFLKI